MANIIFDSFREYSNSVSQFQKFHNQVINMPRDHFSDATLSKLQSLAWYLLLIEDGFPSDGSSYKSMMELMIEKLSDESYEQNQFRNNEIENRYFRTDLNIDLLYEIEGRMFRHLMGLCAFFGLIYSNSRTKKMVNFESCREVILSKDSILMPVFRNNLLYNNINSNDFVSNLKGITLHDNANYRPAYAILRYLKELARPATMFEISILLGRIDDDLQTEREIINRALLISRELPKNQDDQIKKFFGSLNWKSKDGILFQYAASQEPYFKFRTFFLFMEHFKLIEINKCESTVQLTGYSKQLLQDEIPLELLDLEDLLYKIDDDTESDAALADVLLRKRSSEITKAIQSDSTLVEKMNKRSIRKIEYDKDGKRKRNKIIVELAKIKANYICEATGKTTFKTPSGNYYVEAHHIIEFSTEDGPDITDNLLVLGPEKHQLLHKACQEEVDDLYNHLKTNGKITIERFRRMHEIYNCLTPKHVRIIYNKKLISSIDRDDLLAALSDSQAL